MLVVVTGRHRPHEVVFLAFSSMIGLAFIVGAKPPGSLETLMAPWVLWTWYLLLLASGVVGLISFVIRDAYRALALERAAMLGQAAASAVYSVGLLSTGDPRALFAAMFCVAWSAASVWRTVQIVRSIRAIRPAGDEP